MGAFREVQLWLYLMLLCFGLGRLSLLQAEAIMEQDQLEKMLPRLWRLEARLRGFADREALYLSFWRWLASQRGETSNRGSLAAGIALRS
jgi:hypothetical protein